MKLKSVSGFACYVKNLDKTAKFYSDLGFLVGKRDDERMTLRLNWYFLEFIQIDKETKQKFLEDAQSNDKGAGIYIYCSVEDVDDFYQFVLSKGMKPSSEPHDWPWGNREFVLRDPDGYKLVFFKKK